MISSNSLRVIFFRLVLAIVSLHSARAGAKDTGLREQSPYGAVDLARKGGPPTEGFALSPASLAPDVQANSPLRKKRHTNALVLNDGKVSCPVSPAFQGGHGDLSNVQRRRYRNPEKHDATRSGKPRPERQLAKILVKGDENAILGLGAREDLRIAAARRVRTYPDHIVALCL